MAEENQNQAPAPGSAEHDAAMAAKFDGANGAAPEGGQPAAQGGEPELLLGKFKSAEDLAEAYKALEAKLGQPKEDTQGGQEGTQSGDDAAAKAVADAGLNFDALSAEYAEKGELSQEAYEKLEKAGIPKAVVDMYVQGQQALVERLQSTAFSEAGGEDAYSAMTQWATANMSEAEIDAYNSAVNSNNPDVIKLAVNGLKGRYQAANGSEPNLIGGDLGETSGGSYESWAQVTQAMRDPRYAKDPAYRRQVEQTLAKSNPI